MDETPDRFIAAAFRDVRLTDKVLEDLIAWHGRDGTKKGELTHAALFELRNIRAAELARKGAEGNEFPEARAIAENLFTLRRSYIELYDANQHTGHEGKRIMEDFKTEASRLCFDFLPLLTAWNTRNPAATVVGWRPIAEAPRDGRELLLFSRGVRPYVGYFQFGEWNDLRSGIRQPTHFQPLPAPPAGDG